MESKIISVAHDKGGVGKTTIATNILVQLLQDHKQINAIDLDPKKHLTKFLLRRQDDRIKLLDFSSTKELIKIFDDNEGVLIVDVGGLDSDQTRTAIVYSDRVVTPLADSQIELDGLMEFKKVIKVLQSARPDLRATILLNRIHPKTNKSIVDLKEYMQTQTDVFNIFDTVVRDRAAFKVAYGDGKSVSEISGAAKAATEIYNLVKEL